MPTLIPMPSWPPPHQTVTETRRTRLPMAHREVEKEVDINQDHKITSVAYQLPERNATYANQRDKYLGVVRALTFES